MPDKSAPVGKVRRPSPPGPAAIASESADVPPMPIQRGLSDALRRLDDLARENEALGRELLRCYEQLSLVFEITEHIADLRNSEEIERTLLERCATMLNSRALFLELNNELRPVVAEAGWCDSPESVPERISQLLDADLQAVRTSKHAATTTLPLVDPPLRGFVEERGGRVVGEAANAAQILLAPLHRFGAQTAVVIAVRRPSDPPFDSSDLLAAESVLGYGGQVLSNMLMLQNMQTMAFETVCALVRAIDQKDHYTSGHAERVGWLARMTGQALGLAEHDLEMLEWAGLLHDVGKIGISEEILNKPGRLTPEEFEIMKRHPLMSYEVLRPVASLAPILEGVKYHHENHDGSGYPDGLSGTAIPLFARIIHVVDIFDALTSTRSYRAGFTLEKAYAILREGAGTVTDPQVTHTFLEMIDRYRRENHVEFTRRFRIPTASDTAPPALAAEVSP
ncbi:MAG: hypothetical protein CHACPFDD_00010 [Phycisphaerae bacterium]|nr:hypothetical protein [Phycisphaerae bacterium]